MIRWIVSAIILGIAIAATMLWWLGRHGSSDVRGIGSSSDAATDTSADMQRQAGQPSPAVSGVLAQPQVIGNGHSARLLAYRRAQTVAGGNIIADLIQVETCAGGQEALGVAFPTAFALGYRLADGDIEYRSASTALPGIDAPLSTRLTGEPLAAGACSSGWLEFVLGAGRAADLRQPDLLRFNNRQFGFVSEADQGDVSWDLASP